MYNRLACEMAYLAICQWGWTTALINQRATISLYADKGDMSFGNEKRVPNIVNFVLNVQVQRQNRFLT